MYERTGNLDTVFRSSRRMECRLKNIKSLGLKYSDADTSVINVNNSTNKLILTYESKRIKKSSLPISSSANLSISDDRVHSVNVTYVVDTQLNNYC